MVLQQRTVSAYLCVTAISSETVQGWSHDGSIMPLSTDALLLMHSELRPSHICRLCACMQATERLRQRSITVPTQVRDLADHRPG